MVLHVEVSLQPNYHLAFILVPYGNTHVSVCACACTERREQIRTHPKPAVNCSHLTQKKDKEKHTLREKQHTRARAHPCALPVVCVHKLIVKVIEVNV